MFITSPLAWFNLCPAQSKPNLVRSYGEFKMRIDSATRIEYDIVESCSIEIGFFLVRARSKIVRTNCEENGIKIARNLMQVFSPKGLKKTWKNNAILGWLAFGRISPAPNCQRQFNTDFCFAKKIRPFLVVFPETNSHSIFNVGKMCLLPCVRALKSPELSCIKTGMLPLVRTWAELYNVVPNGTS